VATSKVFKSKLLLSYSKPPLLLTQLKTTRYKWFFTPKMSQM